MLPLPSSKPHLHPATTFFFVMFAREGPVEHVQLFRLKYSRQKKWHTEPVELNVHPNRQFPAHFVIHMPSCLHILFYVARPLHSGARGPSLGVCSLGGATILLRAVDYYTGRGGGGWHEAMVLVGLPLVAPIGLSLLCIPTLCGYPYFE